MDAIVEQALKKWPNVPACYGWLGLDARGEWYLRDDAAQHAGPFPQVKGSHITHEKLREFIERNYEADPHGAWFFQNGPQRVYVELEAAPWVWRISGERIESHTGVAARFEAAFLDEAGRLFLRTEFGLGIVHTLDMQAASDQVEAGAWPVETLRFAELPARHGYRLSPAADHAGGA